MDVSFQRYYKTAKQAHLFMTIFLLLITIISVIVQLSLRPARINETTYFFFFVVFINLIASLYNKRWLDNIAGIPYLALGTISIPLLIVVDFGYGLALTFLVLINCWLLYYPNSAGKFLVELDKKDKEE